MVDGDGNPNCALLHVGRMGRNRMSGLDYGPLHSRIKGRAALERRIRGLLIAVHRFGRGRQLTAEDLRWAAKTIDRLTEMLNANERIPPCHPQ